MTMKERIARAILKRRFYDCEPDMYGHDLERFFAEIDSEHIHEARDEAEAVLDALREPDKAMIHAACKAMSPGRRPTPDRVSVREKHTIRYQAMIDAAKAEGQPE